VNLKIAGRFVAISVVLLQLSPAALGQTAPAGSAPPVAAGVTIPAAPVESESARYYEDAVRADALGQLGQARTLARQGLALSPQGPYAASLQRLLDRVNQEELDRIARERLQLAGPHFAARSSPAASKVTFVLSGAVGGIFEGLLIGGAASNSSGGAAVAGGGLAGVAGGLALTLATMSEVSEPTVSAHLTLGWLYGGLAGLAIGGLTENGGTNIALAGAIGLPLGALAGILMAFETNATEGDAAAGTALLLNLAFVPPLFAFAFSGNNGLSSQTVLGTALVGGTIGLLGGELANRQLAWSEGRWAIIGISGFLGAGVGGLIVAAASGSGPGVTAVIAFGDLVGLGVGIAATQGLSDEAPRGYQAPAGPPAVALAAIPPTVAPPGRPLPMFGTQIRLFSF
jgi:hypothetical protein